MQRIDKKYLGLLLAFILLLGIAISFQTIIIEVLVTCLRFEWISLGLVIIAVGIEVIHRVKYESFSITAMTPYISFKRSSDSLASIVTNPTSIVCSFALAKGVVFHLAGQKPEYFPEFNGIEIFFIALVTVYLLVVSTLDLANQVKEIVYEEGSEAVVPVEAPAQEKRKKEN